MLARLRVSRGRSLCLGAISSLRAVGPSLATVKGNVMKKSESNCDISSAMRPMWDYAWPIGELRQHLLMVGAGGQAASATPSSDGPNGRVHTGLLLCIGKLRQFAAVQRFDS